MQKAINRHNEVIYGSESELQKLPFKFSIFSRNYFGISLISVGMSAGVGNNNIRNIQQYKIKLHKYDAWEALAGFALSMAIFLGVYFCETCHEKLLRCSLPDDDP